MAAELVSQWNQFVTVGRVGSITLIDQEATAAVGPPEQHRHVEQVLRLFLDSELTQSYCFTAGRLHPIIPGLHLTDLQNKIKMNSV